MKGLLLVRDLGRIQTCNRLSRNQVFYSVELRGQFSSTKIVYSNKLSIKKDDYLIEKKECNLIFSGCSKYLNTKTLTTIKKTTRPKKTTISDILKYQLEIYSIN